MTQLGPDVLVNIPGGTANTFFAANFVPPVTYTPTATSTLVVELRIADRSTTAVPPGDGGATFIGSNNLGQSAASYIKAAGCGLADFATYASIGFPNVHILQRLGTTTPGSPCVQPLPFCPTDLAPATPNGVVNIDDLLAVINSWGLNGNPSGPRPLGDVAPLPNGNCLVNIDDLLAVINTWGNCPQPPGACCASNGTCSTKTASECATAGGVFQGNFTSCVNVTCPVVDTTNCVDAKALVLGGPAVCEDLTTALPVAAGVPLCGNAFDHVRWYTVIGNGHDLKAETCGGPAGTDTTLAVFCGTSCTSLTCVGANDDGSCGLQSEVTWCSAVGQKYWIVVSNAGAGVYGPFCVKATDLGTTCTTTLQCGPPANDECAGATTITCGSTNTVNPTQYATYTAAATDPDSTCEIAGGGPFTKDASWWYKITTGAGQTSLNLTLCSSTGGTTMDTVLSVYSGSCGALAEVACDDDFCSAPAFGPSKLCAVVSPNTTYLILVDHYAAADPATYNLVVDCNTPCVPPAPCPTCTGTLENLPCITDNADPLLDPNGGCNSTPSAFGFAVTLGTQYCGIASTYATGTQQLRDTDWYLFTPATTGTYLIQTCTDFPGLAGFVTNGTTDVTTCAGGGTVAFVAGAANFPAGVPTTITSTLTGGTKYAVFVGPSVFTGVPCPAAGVRNYQFKVTAGAATGANDECANATTITLPFTDALTAAQVAAYTTNATDPDSSCEIGGGGPFAKVGGWWYKYTPTSNGTITIKTCNSPGVEDTVISVYNTCGGAEVACNDDTCEASGFGRSIISNLSVTANTTYLIFIDCYSGGGSGAGGAFGPVTVNVSAP